MAKRIFTPVKCRICGCTNDQGCLAGCSWVEGHGNICSVCHEFVLEFARYVQSVHQISKASMLRIYCEVFQ